MEAFVYCWTDIKTNKLYVGSHKGSLDDGYVCSSKYMMSEYRKRSVDFIRQIIASGTHIEMRNLEHKILEAVDAAANDDFYNACNGNSKFYHKGKRGPWSLERRQQASIDRKGRKISKEHAEKLHAGRRKSKNSKEHAEAIRKARKGVPMTPESIQKCKEGLAKLPKEFFVEKARKAGKASAEARKNDPIAQLAHKRRMKLWWDERKKKMKGLK